MNKIYFHKKLLFGILFLGLGALFFGRMLIDNPNSLLNWALFLPFMGFTLVGIHTGWQQRFNEKIKPISKEDLIVEFREHEIIFPKGYYYKYSTIKSSNSITLKDITEINLHTFPPSFIINDKEVIFIPHQFKTKLAAFGKRHQIPIIDRFDIWSAINIPFLDTTFDKDYEEQVMENLAQNGVSNEEVLLIRKKIERTMLYTNSIVWEWVELNQFDYLNWTFLTKKKYWWSMEIALRNYKRIRK